MSGGGAGQVIGLQAATRVHCSLGPNLIARASLALKGLEKFLLDLLLKRLKVLKF